MIAVLKDKKGFRKEFYFPRWMPEISVPLIDIGGGFIENGEMSPNAVIGKIIKFYPKGERQDLFGEIVQLYVEI